LSKRTHFPDPQACFDESQIGVYNLDKVHFSAVAPVFANSSMFSPEQQGDVSLDGQVARSRQLTIRQCRKGNSSTSTKAYLAA
jgi:hypothetical protein